MIKSKYLVFLLVILSLNSCITPPNRLSHEQLVLLKNISIDVIKPVEKPDIYTPKINDTHYYSASSDGHGEVRRIVYRNEKTKFHQHLNSNNISIENIVKDAVMNAIMKSTYLNITNIHKSDINLTIQI